MGDPFLFTPRDSVRDQAYLDHRNQHFDAMDLDENEPSRSMSYHFSSTLRNINNQFFNNPQNPALASQAQKNKNKTRAANTKKEDLAYLDMSQFDVSSGLHEWIPTDLIGKVIASQNKRWLFLFNMMRCPTWLLILNPAKYHENGQNYLSKIKQAAHNAKMGGQSNGYILASELGLNGHSAGLSMNRMGKSPKQLTQFQSQWHDELRNIFRTHLSTNDFQGWANALNTILANTFLFSNNMNLHGVGPGDPPVEAVMDRILWDLNLTTYGEELNPKELGSPPYSMLKVAQFMRRNWNEHMQLLSNNFKTSIHM
ncbi:hypothetical protein [Colwellia sp. E150_009]